MKPRKKAERDPMQALSRAFSPMEERILRAFLDLSHESGIESVTLEKVASRAKASFGGVRYHFSHEGRMGLTDSAMIYVLQSAYREINAKLDAARREQESPLLIKVYFESMISWVRSRRSDATFLLYMYYLYASERPTPLPSDVVMRRAVDRIRSILYECVGNGSLPRLNKIAVLALQIHQVIQGTCLSLASGFEPEQQEACGWESIERIVRSHT